MSAPGGKSRNRVGRWVRIKMPEPMPRDFALEPGYYRAHARLSSVMRALATPEAVKEELEEIGLRVLAVCKTLRGFIAEVEVKEAMKIELPEELERLEVLR